MDFVMKANDPGLISYLSAVFRAQVKVLSVEMLEKSTRTAPIKVVVEINGRTISLAFRFGDEDLEHEYRVLRALEQVDLPTPRAYSLELSGEVLGERFMVSDYIEGESLLRHLMAGESWAEDLFLYSAFRLQAIEREDLGDLGQELDEGESALDILERTWAYFSGQNPNPLAEQAYHLLKNNLPEFPPLRFSNGDMYVANFIVQDRTLAGVIDFENAGFSDPLYEFLLTSFCHPELRKRGLEERFCRMLGLTEDVLTWYYGLELFEVWSLVLKYSEPFEGYNEINLPVYLEAWLEKTRTGWVGRGD